MILIVLFHKNIRLLIKSSIIFNPSFCTGIYKEVRSIKSVVTSEYHGNNAPEQWKNYIVIGFKKLENCFDQVIF